MSLACNFEGCTVGETGSCALERDPTTCEHRAGAAAAGEPQISDGADDLGAPVLGRPNGTSAFPSSGTLGPDAVSQMMASRYVTVVGIFGDPESGKTACLASLYLMVAHARLNGWTFADSKSLMAFEDIARGARVWNEGDPPDQMTVHTEMSDDRRPGFLHLRLFKKSDGRRIDLALPDLPGEWTTELVGMTRADRFEFIKSAETIWVVIDGRKLADKEKRQGVISRLGQLVGRLKTLFDGAIPRMIVVVTHRDSGELPDSVSTRITAELAKRDVTGKIIQVAPFSEDESVKAGYGMSEVIDAMFDTKRPDHEFWPSREPQAGSRSYLAFRMDR